MALVGEGGSFVVLEEDGVEPYIQVGWVRGQGGRRAGRGRRGLGGGGKGGVQVVESRLLWGQDV